MEDAKLHVAILSSLGMGHLIPIILLGNCLVTHHNTHVTILIVTTHTSPAESQLLSHHNIPIIKIPAPDISGKLDSDAKLITRLTLIMRETLPAIRSTISTMHPSPHVLIGDLVSTEAWKIADEFKIPKYVFVTCSAWFVSLITYSHVLDKEVKGQYVDKKEPLKIPGCKPVQPVYLGDSMMDRYNHEYEEYVRQGIGFTLSDGILINTWENLESTSLKALTSDEFLRSVVKAPIYPVGPVYKTDEPGGRSKDEVIQLLDKQPNESVLFVCFGSGWMMSAEQITELAYGLELSRQRFVWVVRPPTIGRTTGGGCFFTAGSSSDGTPDYLPEGFLTRTHKICLVILDWTLQVPILKHRSVGGFLTHCGWNSMLESVSNGVPMIAWPLYAEQKLNAAMLMEELRVAVRPKVLPTKKVVGRGEIERMVRRLMESEEGKVMRDKVKELKESGEEALRVNGGSSYNEMCEFIKDCRIKLKSSRNRNQIRIQ